MCPEIIYSIDTDAIGSDVHIVDICTVYHAYICMFSMSRDVWSVYTHTKMKKVFNT
jgi:hypothetical protein